MGKLGEFARIKTLSDEEILEAEKESEAGGEEAYFEPDSYAEPSGDAEPAKEEQHMEHYGEQVQFDVTMDFDDMYRFIMRHAYYGGTGVFGLLISLGSVVLLILGKGRDNALSMVLLIGAACLFTIINPIILWRRAKRQSEEANKVDAPFSYTFSDAGIEVSRQEERVPIKWENILKVREGKTSIYVYLAMNRAFVLPRKCMGGKEEQLKRILSKNMPARKCKIKPVHVEGE